MKEERIDELKKIVTDGYLEDAFDALIEHFSSFKWGKKNLNTTQKLKSHFNFDARQSRIGLITQDKYSERVQFYLNSLLREIADFESRQNWLSRLRSNILTILNDRYILYSVIFQIIILLLYFLQKNDLIISWFSSSIETKKNVDNLFALFTILSVTFISYRIGLRYLNQYNINESYIEDQISNENKIDFEEIYQSIGLETLGLIRKKIVHELIDYYPINSENSDSTSASVGLTDIEKSLEADTKYEELGRYIIKSENRIKSEILLLQKRANSNLLIGTSTAIIALLVLVYTAFTIDSKFSNFSEFTYVFIPRFTLIVFIQIFSFYFLKLYRTSLSEIKYYQNELTGLELKFLSYRTSIVLRYSTKTQELITELFKVDRNPILKNYDSTSNLENLKLENEFHKTLINRLANLNIFNKKD